MKIEVDGKAYTVVLGENESIGRPTASLVKDDMREILHNSIYDDEPEKDPVFAIDPGAYRGRLKKGVIRMIGCIPGSRRVHYVYGTGVGNYPFEKPMDEMTEDELKGHSSGHPPSGSAKMGYPFRFGMLNMLKEKLTKE